MSRPSPQAAAFETLVQAIRDLAAARGHDLGRPLEEGDYQVALMCRTCERWLCIYVPGATDAPSITGQALVTCPRKAHAGIRIMDNGLQAAESAFATIGR